MTRATSVSLAHLPKFCQRYTRNSTTSAHLLRIVQVLAVAMFSIEAGVSQHNADPKLFPLSFCGNNATYRYLGCKSSDPLTKIDAQLGSSMCAGRQSWRTSAIQGRPVGSAGRPALSAASRHVSPGCGDENDTVSLCSVRTCQSCPDAGAVRTYSVASKRSPTGKRWGVDYVDDQNKRVRKIVANTENEANAYLARVRVALERGTYYDSGRDTLTLGELIEVARTKGTKSAHRDVERLRQVAGLLGEDRLIRTITPAVWEEVRSTLMARGLRAPASRNRVLISLRSTIRRAIRLELLATDPLRHTQHEREDNIRHRTLVGTEEERLWKACCCQTDRTVLALALHTAARCGEMHRARFGDFDLEAMSWHLPRTKNGKPRTLPLTPTVLREVQALRAEADGEQLFTCKTPSALSQRMMRIRDRAGVTDIGLHDLRRSAATRAIVAGVPLTTVLNVLGHSNLKTAHRYLAITAEHTRAFAEAMPADPPIDHDA